MKHTSIQRIVDLFHEKTDNVQFVEQTIAQIKKDSTGLCDPVEVNIDFQEDLIPQFRIWIAKILNEIERAGNSVLQFLYQVDLPESELTRSELNLIDAILFREAQKVYFRNRYQSK